MSARHQDTQKHSKQHETKQPKSAHATGQSEAPQKDKDADKRPDRTAGQNRAVDQKRNDEQQYHAGDVGEETRSDDAPYNKTYGRHE